MAHIKLPRAEDGAAIPMMDMARITRALEQTGANMKGLVLWQSGRIVGSHWWAPFTADDPQLVYSISKSFTGTAVGLAVDDGLLDIDAPVLSFFSEHAPATPSANLLSMTVRHLLTMATGHRMDTLPDILSSDGDWVEAFLSLPVEEAPGSQFVYNTGASYMLAAIVETVTGQPMADYLSERLFRPLGFAPTAWDRCPNGRCTGGWGLVVRLEDMVKLGILYLQKGLWAGERILSEQWTTQATAFQQRTGANAGTVDWQQGYGFQFWRATHNAYRADGAFGQFCIVLPELDAVVAIHSEVANMQTVSDAVWAQVLPVLAGMQQPARTTPLRYRLDENPLALSTLVLATENDRLRITLTDQESRAHDLCCGRTDWQRGTTTLPFARTSFIAFFTETGNAEPYFARYSDVNPGVLSVELLYPQSPHRGSIHCHYTAETVDIHFESTIDPLFAGTPEQRLTGRADTGDRR